MAGSPAGPEQPVDTTGMAVGVEDPGPAGTTHSSPRRGGWRLRTVAAVLVAVLATAAIVAALALEGPDEVRAEVLGPEATMVVPGRAVAERWALPQDEDVLSLVVDGDRVLVADVFDGGLRLRSLALATGQRAWVRELGPGVAVAVVDGREVLLTAPNPSLGPSQSVMAVSAADGGTRWRRRTPGVETMAGREGGLLLAGASWCHLVDAGDGRTRFEHATSACRAAGPAVVVRADEHEVRTWTGRLLATHPRHLRAPVVGDGMLYRLEGDLLRGEALQGPRRWQVTLPAAARWLEPLEGRGVALQRTDTGGVVVVSPVGIVTGRDLDVGAVFGSHHVRIGGDRVAVRATTRGADHDIAVHDPAGRVLARRTAVGVTLLRDPSWQLTTVGMLLPGPTGDWRSLSLHRYEDLAVRWSVGLRGEQLVRLAGTNDAVVVVTRRLDGPRGSLRVFR